MILIVGLGNPGKKYEKTRHNVGFRVVDALKKSLDFTRDKLILFKPQTFMNQSGKAVKSLMAYYKLPIANLWIIHDDIDLPLGAIRVSQNVGSAGHKGVESIIKALGTKEFLRFRIGIGREQKKDAEKFVLKKFTKEEEKILERVIKEAIEIIKTKI
jgi:PTH1 family peptidyl-tRNA hydrolase